MISRVKGFTDYAAISNEGKKIQEELRNEIESKEYAISTFGEDTEAYMEEKLNLGEKKGELSKKIELSCGFEELRTILNEFGGVKIGKWIKK